MFLTNQFGPEVLVQFDPTEVCSAHFPEDRFGQLGLPWVVREEYAAENLQVADAGSLGFDLWSDEAVFLHVFGPVLLVFRCLGNGHPQLPHSIEWSSVA